MELFRDGKFACAWSRKFACVWSDKFAYISELWPGPLHRAGMFDLAKVNVHWFPSHMARGMQLMERKLRKMQVVVEVRDARIPFSSANPLLEELGREIKRIVVFNKTDLADPLANQVVLARDGPAVLDGCRG